MPLDLSAIGDSWGIYRIGILAQTGVYWGTCRREIERPVTAHSLRHTFANRLRRKTGDLRVVRAALEHRQLAGRAANAWMVMS